MSLFGSGRREGVVAAISAGVIAFAAHLATSWGSHCQFGQPTTGSQFAAACAAIAGLLMYRFLRVYGRTRYTAFLGGMGYGMCLLFADPLLTPREHFATAFAPLPLIGAAHFRVAATHGAWLPCLAPFLVMPFLLGTDLVALQSVAVALVLLFATLRKRSASRGQTVGAWASIVFALAAIGNIVWLDPHPVWLDLRWAPAPPDPIVTISRLNPLFVWFTMLGLMRRQRQQGPWPWLTLLALGIGAACCTAPSTLWSGMLAVLVLGSASLDDWLEGPQRRRSATLWLALLTVMLLPALWLLDAPHPLTAATTLGALATMTVATIASRHLGVLRYKNVLTGIAIAIGTLQLWRNHLDAPTAAAPLGEASATTWKSLALASTSIYANQPWWHFAGPLSAGALSLVILAALACGRGAGTRPG